MATERLSMRKTREILRFKWVHGRTHRETARSLGISSGTVSKVVTRAKHLGLDWSEVQVLSDEELEFRLYGTSVSGRSGRPKPNWPHVHRELRRPGVSLELLHIEYLNEHPDGYKYSAFCRHYNLWREQQNVAMRQVHRGGAKLFVDYSGKKPSVIDPATGEVRDVELFVSVLGASNFTYAEATETQTSRDWISSHVRALEYFGGVTEAIVPDQLKSGVTSSCRYEPGIQRTYEEFSRHYETIILPARPGKPRDKAKVEVGVQVVQRWVLACLRNEEFFSLAALNRRIWELLEQLNDRPMKGYGGLSRRQMYEQYDASQLKALPAERFEYAEWKKAKVNIDYHVDVGGHFYSVPYQLARETVEVRTTASMVEIYSRGQRVVSHTRNDRRGYHTTVADHMPKLHRKHLEWTPSRIINWGASIGPSTCTLVTKILESRPHPEMGYRSCLGILRLAKQYGKARLEAACERSVRANARSYRHVAAILKNGLDRVPLDESRQPELPIVHEHVRGADYYTQGDTNNVE